MSVPVQHPMYIDGQFVTWRGDAWIDVVNPATEAVISRIPDGQAEDARKAIDAAERAQPELLKKGARSSSWLKSKWLLLPTISITSRSGHGVTRARLFKAIVQEKIFFCLNVRLV